MFFSLKKHGKTLMRFSFGYGELTAVIVSWTLNKSILWALFHMLFGWYYIWYVIVKGILSLFAH
jgi:hypothetical protein